MAPKLKGLPFIEQLPDGTIPLNRGEVVALPDAAPDDPDYDENAPVEYGIIRSVGLSEGIVYLDLEVYDSRAGYAAPAEGEDPQLRRVPYVGGIQ
jgi:hypothetical protein